MPFSTPRTLWFAMRFPGRIASYRPCGRVDQHLYLRNESLRAHHREDPQLGARKHLPDALCASVTRTSHSQNVIDKRYLSWLDELGLDGKAIVMRQPKRAGGRLRRCRPLDGADSPDTAPHFTAKAALDQQVGNDLRGPECAFCQRRTARHWNERNVRIEERLQNLGLFQVAEGTADDLFPASLDGTTEPS